MSTARLVPCPTCGREVATTAVACPGCGTPDPRRTAREADGEGDGKPRCRNCGVVVSKSAVRCPACKEPNPALPANQAGCAGCLRAYGWVFLVVAVIWLLSSAL